MNQRISPDFFPWEGEYSDWQDAARIASESNRASIAAFDSNRWARRQKSFLELARNGEVPRTTALPGVAAEIGAKSFIDFGGGSGWTYFAVKRRSGHEIETYTVVELTTVAEVFSTELLSDTPPVRFVTLETALKEQSRVIDILYANSVLQYTPDNEALLQLVQKYRPRSVLLDDIQTASKLTFSIQRYHGLKIPVRFSVISQLEEEMQSVGYQKKRVWKYLPTDGSFVAIPNLSSAGLPMSILFTASPTGGRARDENVRDTQGLGPCAQV